MYIQLVNKTAPFEKVKQLLLLVAMTTDIKSLPIKSRQQNFLDKDNGSVKVVRDAASKTPH